MPDPSDPRATPAEPSTTDETLATRRERDLPTTPAETWTLLQDAEGLERWLADEVELVVAPGERGTVHEGGIRREVEVEDVDPGRRLSLRWWSDHDEPSLVDLTIEETAEGSRLVVTELPVRLVGAPTTVPASWSVDAGSGRSEQPRALARA